MLTFPPIYCATTFYDMRKPSRIYKKWFTSLTRPEQCDCKTLCKINTRLELLERVLSWSYIRISQAESGNSPLMIHLALGRARRWCDFCLLLLDSVWENQFQAIVLCFFRTKLKSKPVQQREDFWGLSESRMQIDADYASLYNAL